MLLITSRGGKGLVFPKGGWEQDEDVKAAAARETVEEAGVRGELEVRQLARIMMHFEMVGPEAGFGMTMRKGGAVGVIKRTGGCFVSGAWRCAGQLCMLCTAQTRPCASPAAGYEVISMLPVKYRRCRHARSG